MKIAIWDPQNIGDHLLATPAIRAYSKRFDTQVDILYDPKPHGHKGSINLLEANPYVGNQIITRHWDITPYFKEEYMSKYDKILVSHYGGFKERKEHILKVTCDNFEFQWPEVKIEDRKIDIFLTQSDEQIGKEFIDSIIILPCADFMSYNRLWDADKWVKLVEWLRSKGQTVFQIGAKTDPLLVQGANDIRGLTSVRETCAALKYCKLHIAVSTFTEIVTNYYHAPAIILHGYIEPEIVGWPNNINLTSRVDCSPCWDRNPCPTRKCMRSITVEMVKTKVMELLKWE